MNSLNILTELIESSHSSINLSKVSTICRPMFVYFVSPKGLEELQLVLICVQLLKGELRFIDPIALAPKRSRKTGIVCILSS